MSLSALKKIWGNIFIYSWSSFLTKQCHKILTIFNDENCLHGYLINSLKRFWNFYYLIKILTKIVCLQSQACVGNYIYRCTSFFCFINIRKQSVESIKFYWNISGYNGLTYQPVCKSPCKAFCSKLGGSKHKIEINQAKYYFVNCSWMNGKWFSEKKTIKQNILRLKGTVSQ